VRAAQVAKNISPVIYKDPVTYIFLLTGDRVCTY